MSADMVFRADTSPMDSTLAKAEDSAERSQQAIMNGFRQAAAAGVIVAEISGSVMGQLYTSYIEFVFVGIDVLKRAGAATSLATFGISGVFMIAQLIAMGFLITQLHQKQSEQAARSSRFVALARMGSIRIIFFPLSIVIYLMEMIL